MDPSRSAGPLGGRFITGPSRSRLSGICKGRGDDPGRIRFPERIAPRDPAREVGRDNPLDIGSGISGRYLHAALHLLLLKPIEGARNMPTETWADRSVFGGWTPKSLFSPDSILLVSGGRGGTRGKRCRTRPIVRDGVCRRGASLVLLSRSDRRDGSPRRKGADLRLCGDAEIFPQQDPVKVRFER